MSGPTRDGGDKGPDAFRTISEVADDLGLPQHVLRFWETRFPQIKPIKRGGGRRYYRPNDVDLLRGIKHLLYGEGYTIRGVQRILREQGGRKVAGFADGGAPAPDPLDGDRVSDSAAKEASKPEKPPEHPRPTAGLMAKPSGPEIWAPQRRLPLEAPSGAVEIGVPEPNDARAVVTEGRSIDSERSPQAGPSLTRPAGLSEARKRRLRDVLADLQACRRLVDERL